eukprot:TRINITY_DN5297_c0_g1_i5.p1 TRINITY_DN5297_c0_g1~~TRINITY_DN5297_c0_g1_i5.p1  ORF type:complete len:1126 (-),score=347.60 TRINITY_DN5297_c0_g1_i5:142-3519(-)
MLSRCLPGRTTGTHVLAAFHGLCANWHLSTAHTALRDSIAARSTLRNQSQLMLASLGMRLHGTGQQGKVFQAVGVWKGQCGEHRVAVQRDAQIKCSSELQRSGLQYSKLCRLRCLHSMVAWHARLQRSVLKSTISNWFRNELKDTRRITVLELLEQEKQSFAGALRAAYHGGGESAHVLLLRWALRSTQHAAHAAQGGLVEDNERLMTDLAMGAMWSRGIQVVRGVVHRSLLTTMRGTLHVLRSNHQHAVSCRQTMQHTIRRRLLSVLMQQQSRAVHQMRLHMQEEAARKIKLTTALVHLGALEHVRAAQQQQRSLARWAAQLRAQRVAAACMTAHSKESALGRVIWVRGDCDRVFLACLIRRWVNTLRSHRILAGGMLRVVVCVSKLCSQLDAAYALHTWRAQQQHQGGQQQHTDWQRIQDNIHRRDLTTGLNHQRAVTALLNIGVRDWVLSFKNVVLRWKAGTAHTAQRRAKALGIMRMTLHGVSAQLLGSSMRAWLCAALRSTSNTSMQTVTHSHGLAARRQRHQQALALMIKRLQLWSVLSTQRCLCSWQHNFQQAGGSQAFSLRKLASVLQALCQGNVSRSVLSWRAACCAALVKQRTGLKWLRSFLWRTTGVLEAVQCWHSRAMLWTALAGRGLKMLDCTVRGQRRMAQSQAVEQWKTRCYQQMDGFRQAMSMLTGVCHRRHTKLLKLAWVGMLMGWRASKRPKKSPKKVQQQQQQPEAQPGNKQMWARCVEQFSGFEANDLDLAIGDMVAVLQQHHQTWEGICAGREGKFPKDAVELLPPAQRGAVDNNGRTIRHSVELHDELERLEKARAAELSQMKQVKRTNKQHEGTLTAAARSRHIEAMFALLREMKRSQRRHLCGRAIVSWWLNSSMDLEQLELEGLASQVIQHNSCVLAVQLLAGVTKQRLTGFMATCVHVWWSTAIAWQADQALQHAGQEMELCLEVKNYGHGLSLLTRTLRALKDGAQGCVLLSWRDNQRAEAHTLSQSIVEECMLEVMAQNNALLGLKLLCYLEQRRQLRAQQGMVLRWKRSVDDQVRALKSYTKILRRWTEQWVKVKLRSWKVLASLARPNNRARAAASQPPVSSPDNRLAQRAKSMRQVARDRRRLSLNAEAGTSEA